MRKENMSVSQIITITKPVPAKFSTVDDAIDSFLIDNPTDKNLNEIFTKAAVASGDLIMTGSLTEDKNGYILNRVWSDAKWEEKTTSPKTNELADSDNNPVSYTENINGWTKKVELSYTS